MLQNIQELYGDKLAASDGEIGHVNDFYFDDKTWVIRYLVADTGSWLSERLVLLSPHAFGRVDSERDLVTIKLTRGQIENSPPIDAHRTVSRQFEQDYYQYYGWPVYWDGEAIEFAPAKKQTPHHGHNQRNDRHLRSTKEVTGYEIEASDGTIGLVKSFMVDDKSWAIGDMVVEAGPWYSGKEVLIASSKIRRVSYDESKVFVNLTRSDIQQTAQGDVVKAGV